MPWNAENFVRFHSENTTHSAWNSDKFRDFIHFQPQEGWFPKISSLKKADFFEFRNTFSGDRTPQFIWKYLCQSYASAFHWIQSWNPWIEFPKIAMKTNQRLWISWISNGFPIIIHPENLESNTFTSPVLILVHLLPLHLTNK